MKFIPKKKSTVPVIKITGDDEKHPRFFLNTGCRILNLALTGDAWNGGWPGQRIINIIGSQAIGKTLLACEAINQLYYNWHNKGKKVKATYDEPEAAFDFQLGREFKMPLEWINWRGSDTVEEFYISTYKDLRKDKEEKLDFHLIILDSLDNLSDAEEIERTEKLIAGKEVGGTYGSKKAKELKAGLRQLASRVKKENATIIIISQVIDLISRLAMGKLLTRAGGHGLDHNASVIMWLKEIEPITRTLSIGDKPKKITVGKKVEVKVTKNRLYRENARVIIEILDRYGVDDIGTMLNWLEEWGFLDKEKQSYKIEGIIDKGMTREKLIKEFEDAEKYKKLVDFVQVKWAEIEERIRLDRKPKYGRIDNE